MTTPRPTADQEIQSALPHHQSGRLAEAEKIYRDILSRDPKHPRALHLLGLIAHQTGRNDNAADLIRQSIALHPDDPQAHFNLGIVLAALGRFDDAIASFSQAIALQPDYADAHNNLGNALRALGKTDRAVAAYSAAIRVDPRHGQAHVNLANALREQGQLEQAIPACLAVIQLQPAAAEAYTALGNALHDQGRLDDAVVAHAQAIQLSPESPDAHNNLANVLIDQKKFDEAIIACRRAIQLKPAHAQAHVTLGNALVEQGKLDDAIAAYTTAIELQPDRAQTHNNLANAFKARGRIEQALACYNRGMKLQPDNPALHGNFIYALYFSPAHDVDAINRELSLWNHRHADPLRRSVRPHDNDRSPGRRLRIGYSSPDFHNHVIGRNILPLLRHHHRRRFEIFCYSDLLQADDLTRQFQTCADAWRNTPGLTHAQWADQVRADRIDILVDLTLHTARNRLPAFARKPAPVQVTFAGYPAGTGLHAMDYRLTDPYLDPAPQSDSQYVEKSIRLPDSFWCYDPALMTRGADIPPDPGPLPALTAGHITFGCINNFCKVNELVLRLWACILRSVPGSRLILLAPEGTARQNVRRVLAQSRIDPVRVEFIPQAPPKEYFHQYQRIDIALDTFPYNGHTTTLDALWMGVPIITLVGNTAVGRAGWSHLSNLGLQNLAARDPGQYVHLAVTLAGDRARLQSLRSGLPDRMRKSPLTDAARFARNIEAAYRQMWRQWTSAR